MKIFCVGRNYADHAKELGNEVPSEPVIFMKPKSALLQPQTPFYYPNFSNELHYEAEVVLRISKNGRFINEKYAHKYYNAFSLGIDFTARDIQRDLKAQGLPWEKAKAWDNSAVIGKWLPFADADTTVSSIIFSLTQNEKVVQEGNTKDMLFSFSQVIANISQYFSINIGDVIFTGTPAGVGECLPGDKLEGFIAATSVFVLDIK